MDRREQTLNGGRYFEGDTVSAKQGDDPNDVREVYREEKGRGRRQRIDVEARKREKEFLALMRWLLEFGNQEDLEGALIALGVGRGSDRWNAALDVWRKHRASGEP
jgi:hypothetical protein